VAIDRSSSSREEKGAIPINPFQARILRAALSGRTGPYILEGGKKMYETPMLVEVGAFTDLTRKPKRKPGHDHRCRSRKRPKGGYGY